MKVAVILCLLCALAVQSSAQKEIFDIVSFNAPGGWKKEMKETVVGYSFVDKKDGSWCQIAVYKSTGSKGNIDKDFQNEWNELVAKVYNITDQPQTTDIPENGGWKTKAGTGKFIFNNKPAAAMLTTISGFGKCVSIVATTADERYLENIQDLMASVELIKPESNNNNSNLSQSSAPVNQDSYVSLTTNFDDGWTSTVQNDWILVTKNDIKVYVWYALPYDYKIFTGTGVVDRDYYWDNYVSKYFNIESKQYKDNGEVIGSLKPTYVEGWATDKQTGERRFVGMRLDISPNTAYITIGSAKDEASLWQQFPKANGGSFAPSELSAMSGYNKFAVSVHDIAGTWQDGVSSAMQWYYSTPSGYEGYAGMTVAARSATFNFNADGSYTSIHNGATGSVGAMSTFQQNYKGKYTLSNWNLTATNRFEGKTESFDAWFKMVRGGKLLCLKTGGMVYTLVRTK